MMVAEDGECSIDELYVAPLSFKYVEVAAHSVPYIVGRGGRIICQLETVYRVFLTLTNLSKGSHKMLISGLRPACIFTEFAIELLSSGHHSALTTLSSLCF